jgi:hypothetical protein
VIDLISAQQEKIGDMAMEVERESVQQNQVPTEHHPVRAWGMDARMTSYFRNRYGEYCCLGIRMEQTPCNHNGCNATVHPICHINWLSCIDLNFITTTLSSAQGTVFNTRIMLECGNAVTMALQEATMDCQ